MKFLQLILMCSFISPLAQAGSFDCVANIETKIMTLRDGGMGPKKSAMIFKEGSWETHCPFTRGKMDDKKVKGVRTLTVRYKRAGPCGPNPLPGKTSRAALNLVLTADKSGKFTGSLDDPNKNAAAPCDLEGFTLKSLGLKK